MENPNLVWLPSPENPHAEQYPELSYLALGVPNRNQGLRKLLSVFMDQLASLISAISKRRNEFIHKEIQPNPINLIEQISNTRGNRARNFHTSKAWRAPREDTIKNNCDATFKTHLQYASIAAIVRDSTRTILSVSPKLIPVAPALITEAIAVREEVSLASGSYNYRTLIESDNLAVIEAIRGGNQPCSTVQMVKDIQMSSSLTPNCGFVQREGNQLGHSIAQATLLTGDGIHSILAIPRSCRDSTSLDERGK
ncbi:Reverse transcriptase-like [Sesbania bispinosa]|nr:Reverse transcriptase-like [Sesbania bispinosa]